MKHPSENAPPNQSVALLHIHHETLQRAVSNISDSISQGVKFRLYASTKLLEKPFPAKFLFCTTLFCIKHPGENKDFKPTAMWALSHIHHETLKEPFPTYQTPSTDIGNFDQTMTPYLKSLVVQRLTILKILKVCTKRSSGRTPSQEL